MIRTLSVSLGLTIALLLPHANVFAEEKGDQSKNTGYAGNDTCLGCHRNQALAGPHAAKTNPDAPAGEFGCEKCHGLGLQHASEQENSTGKSTSLFIKQLGSKSPLSAEERSAVCLECHNNGHTALWQGSTHERRGVACTDCHSIHSHNKKYLAKASETEVCTQCHKDVRADLMKNSHHPIREGKVTCSDCHNPHGTVADKLISADTTNNKCFECHAEKRGPFLWEHEPVRENCMTCHTPHGSAHDKLLVSKPPLLCQTCHSNSRHPGTMYSIPAASASRSVYTALGNRVYYRACLNCHAEVHGSNHPSGKSLSR